MGQSPKMWACKCLRTKYFHRVSSGYQHPYSLKSRYGKVRLKVLFSRSDLTAPFNQHLSTRLCSVKVIQKKTEFISTIAASPSFSGNHYPRTYHFSKFDAGV